MDKAAIAEFLEEMALLKGLMGENEFKIRAYGAAARAMLTTELDPAALAAAGELHKIKGIGKHIEANITAFISSGSSPEMDELHSTVPPGVLEMLRVPGVGPKKARALWTELGISSVSELEYACASNRLADLKGFGDKSQKNIMEGIATLHKFSGRFLLPDAQATAHAMLDHLATEPSVKIAAIAGSTRRSKEIIKDVDLVAASATPEKVMDHFTFGPAVTSVLSKGTTKASVMTAEGMQVDLRVVSERQFPFALHHFTGSKEHNTAMRSRALSMGIKMNEYGLFRGEERIECADEREIFNTLGLGYIPPERRENIGEISEAEGGAEPELVTYKDIRGIFHLHTTASDGVESLETMAKACMDRGWEYMGVAEHSRAAHYAGGLSTEALLRQGEEIDRLNKKLKGFRIFKGVESDILEDGALDYPDDVLAQLDFVIASIHTRFKKEDEARVTRRLIAAAMSPYTTIIGHPTGRLLLSREAYPVNMPQLIEACAANEVIIELNANPQRLDIDWRELAAVRRAGGMISINPDAHRVHGLDHVKYGVTTARKGGVKPGMVLNTMGADKVAAFLADLRARRLAR
ncbi:MAG: DNA polymerase/3'-5' exonuclease PolX [Nitrospinota bacterium]|nr:DNA polymerase/3'-5' exonuclease PolX [Nitrospinota bacterium]